MATPKVSTKSPTIRRILKEASELSQSPSPDYTATPLETDLFEWHFTLRGPPNSAFSEGIYHGRIVLPPTYPLRPPSFRFTTPSGRFEANREICLSISGHHEETWQPAWGVRTAIVALRSFMETSAAGQIGGLDATEAVRRKLAAASRGFTCATCAKSNEDILREVSERCRELEAEASASGAGAGKAAEVEVPAELKMGFRDEMEKAAKEAVTAAGSTPNPTSASRGGGGGGGSGGVAPATAAAEDDAESAQLAEGFVQTVPMQRLESSLPGSATAQQARPGQGVPQPTRTIPLPQTPAQQQRQQQRRRVDPNAGVPIWVDYAIVAFAGVLIAMLIKILLGY
ncbi:ubiquitin-conjugating enzyme/RWD-like protein [Xylariales sp. PMI_506]|nr:ubiquitin-conjugating enzyme/RWD-like protein [Xylariales sp. PMI_506]